MLAHYRHVVAEEREIVADEDAPPDREAEREGLVMRVPKPDRDPHARLLDGEREDAEEAHAVVGDGVFLGDDLEVPVVERFGEGLDEPVMRDGKVRRGGLGRRKILQILTADEHTFRVRKHCFHWEPPCCWLS